MIIAGLVVGGISLYILVAGVVRVAVGHRVAQEATEPCDPNWRVLGTRYFACKNNPSPDPFLDKDWECPDCLRTRKHREAVDVIALLWPVALPFLLLSRLVTVVRMLYLLPGRVW